MMIYQRTVSLLTVKNQRMNNPAFGELALNRLRLLRYLILLL